MVRKIFLILIIANFFSGFFISKTYAYEVATHAFLTKEIIDFYNKNFKNKISDELKEYLIDGARLEDNMPRYLNHFYDPVNNLGLHDLGFKGFASKEWAQSAKKQTALIYKIFPQTEASLLSASQIEKIKPAFSKTDFSWQKAVDFYVDGKIEQSFFALGHTLHLIEDSSVPDHTRNDAHPPFDDGGSPYENWTKQFTLENPDNDLSKRLENKKPILLASLNEYFDGIANYSNNNFYSKDSIRNYELPKPDYFDRIGDNIYGFKLDPENGNYRLFIKSEGLIKNETTGDAKIFSAKEEGDIVVRDYWSRLSVKATQYGSGVIDLFFKEAEKAKAEYERKKAERPYLGTLIEGFKSVFEDNKDGGAPVAVIPIKDLKSDAAADDNKQKIVEEKEEKQEVAVINSLLRNADSESEIKQKVADIEDNAAESNRSLFTQNSGSPVEKKEEFRFCNFITDKNPSRQKVVINEVAWMGTVNSSNDEWIELKNISSGELDLSGLQVLDMGEQIKIQLEGKIPAGGFYLLERTDDNAVPGVAMDQKYTGVLANAGEGLRLFDKNCGLIDEVLASPDWPTGDNNYKRTMERASDLSWRTYSGDGQNGIFGTPKSENSIGIVPASNGGGGGSAPPVQNSNQPNQNNQTSSNQNTEQDQVNQSNQSSQPVSNGVNHIVISEILFDAEGSDTGKEFIELYNSTDQTIDLSQWSIQHLSGSGSLTKKNFEVGQTIAPKSFFLIWLGNDSRADLVWSSGSLNNTSATIYLADSANYISTTSPVSVDSVNYDINQLTGFAAGQSLERKAFQNNNCVSPQNNGEYIGNSCDTDNTLNDFEVRTSSNPQNSQSLPEPRSAPAAVRDFNVDYSSSDLELVFNWDPPSGDNGSSTSAASYKIWDTGTTTPIFIVETASTTFSQKISEIGRDYKFEIVAIDQDGLSSAVVQKLINVPSFLNSLSFYKDSLKYLVEFNWNEYPFIPIKLKHLVSKENVDSNWHAAIFYYNQEPDLVDVLSWFFNPPEGSWGLNMPGGLRIAYPNCFGSSQKTTGTSLILPATADDCSALQGYQASYALNWNQLEDNHLLLEVTDDNFPAAIPEVNGDYVTVAFYAYQPGYEPNNYGLSLVAVDKTKYYFQENIPAHAAPSAPSNAEFDFNETTSLLKIKWDKSEDADTLDDLLTYEITYNGISTTTTDNFIEILAEPETHYDFMIRAKDDFGNFSDPGSFSYDTPEISLPYNLESVEWGSNLRLNFPDFPFIGSDNPTAMIFFLNQSPLFDHSFLNDDYRQGVKIGGSNRVLKFSYLPCDFNGSWLNPMVAGGLIFNNDDCLENASSVFMDQLLLAQLNSGDEEFTAEVVGILDNGEELAADFDEDDYVTIGFYELAEADNQGNRYFKNIANYNKKIYFQSDLSF